MVNLGRLVARHGRAAAPDASARASRSRPSSRTACGTRLVDPAQLETAMLNLAHQRPRRHGRPSGKLTIEAGNAILDDDYARGSTRGAAGAVRRARGVATPARGIAAARSSSRSSSRSSRPSRQGKGTGLGLSHGLRLRQAVRRPREDLQRAGAGHDGASSTCRAPTQPRTRRSPVGERRRSPAAPRRSWSPRTTTACARPSSTLLARPRLPGADRQGRSERARRHRERRAGRPALHRRGHARAAAQHRARADGPRAAAGHRGAVHLGLHRELDRPRRPARRRRRAALQALHPRGAGAPEAASGPSPRPRRAPARGAAALASCSARTTR